MSYILTIDALGLTPNELDEVCRSAVAEASPLVKIKNLQLQQVDRSTPSDWRDDCTTPNDELFVEVCSKFGTVYGYADLQEGRLIQEIFPILRDAGKQVGSGSVKLELHTEDPALEYRADYLGFLCVSNRDKIPTIVSVPNLEALSGDSLERLMRPVFRILSDRPAKSGDKNPDLVTPVVFPGDAGRRKFIYDPVYIVKEELSDEDRAAFEEFARIVDDGVTDFLLEPGEIGFIDNYRVAHGRPQYVPRYDGTDRWLKRAQISRNLDNFTDRAIIPGRLMP